MCRRLERRFRCIGIQQVVLDDAQASLLGCRRGQRVVVTAWSMDQAGAVQAMQLFVGDGDGGLCAPGSLRCAFGPDAVLGPVLGSAGAFFPQSALFPERTSAPAPEAATTPHKAARPREPAAPLAAAPCPSGGKGKASGEITLPTITAASSTAQSTHRGQTTKPVPPLAPVAMPLPRPLVPARPRLPPLVSLAVDPTPAGAAAPIQLCIVPVRPLINLSITAGGLRIATSGAAVGPPSAGAAPSKPPLTSPQQRGAGGAPAGVAGPPAVPLTGGNFQSARHTSAMASALRRADRGAQYIFHSGRVPWYVPLRA